MATPVVTPPSQPIPEDATATITESPAPTATPDEREPGWALDSLLSWVLPPVQDLDKVLLVDVDRLSRQLDVDQDCSDDEAISEYVVALTASSFFLPQGWGDARVDGTAFEAEYGVSLCEVTAAADSQSVRRPYAWVVDVAQSDIVSALEADPSWSDELTVETYRGKEVFGWGNSPVGDLSRLSAARPGGFGGRVVLEGDVFVRSSNERELVAVLDAQQDASTLASYESVQELVAYMDNSNAHTAIIYRSLEATLPNTIPGGIWESFEELDDAIAARPKLAPYEFFALVVGSDDEADAYSVAVLNTMAEDALDNTERLRAVLEEGVRLNAGPDARWTDLTGEELRSETFGRLSLANFTAERDRERFLRIVQGIDRDGLRWFES